MDKVQKIRQEIEKRIKNLEFSLENNCVEKHSKLDILGNITTLESLLQFIEPLQETKKTGVELISDERQRQIEKEGWTAEHDAEHTYGELADAAVMYAMRGYWKKRIDPMIVGTEDMPGIMWPFRGDGFKPSTDGGLDGRIRDLVKAGALIAAEIDRLLNLKNRHK
jgi:hypothetical protein